MATTPNYGWVTPAPTDFVTDLPADFEIFADAVDDTLHDLNPETTEGDLAYLSATADVKTRLGIGTAGQVLKVNSGATAPEWGSVTAGGMTLLAEIDVTAVSSIAFTSINQTHKHLLITWEDIIRNGANGTMYFNINDAGADHIWANYRVTGSTLAGSTDNQGRGPLWILPNSTTPGNNGALWIFDYADTTFRKPFEGFAYGYNSASSALAGDKTIGQYDADTAVTKVSFIFNGTVSARGTFKLYGVS